LNLEAAGVVIIEVILMERIVTSVQRDIRQCAGNDRRNIRQLVFLQIGLVWLKRDGFGFNFLFAGGFRGLGGFASRGGFLGGHLEPLFLVTLFA
jgi:hypothetical protein